MLPSGIPPDLFPSVLSSSWTSLLNMKLPLELSRTWRDVCWEGSAHVLLVVGINVQRQAGDDIDTLSSRRHDGCHVVAVAALFNHKSYLMKNFDWTGQNNVKQWNPLAMIVLTVC